MKRLRNLTLEKAYKGHTYKVMVKNGKPEIRITGESLRSLSGIASFVTGHPTSGEYFFGIAKYPVQKNGKHKKVLATK